MTTEYFTDQYQIHGVPSGEIGMKRFHIPGLKVKGICIHCGKNIDTELDGDSISYPRFDEEYHYPLVCPHCNKITNLKLAFDLKVICMGYEEDNE